MMDRLLRDNGGVVIMKDPSFLIHGARTMETGHFSFHTSLLGRLYHLITWHGGSILGLGPCTLAWVGSHCGPSFFIGYVPQIPS